MPSLEKRVQELEEGVAEMEKGALARLDEFTTEELVAELEKREGVESRTVSPHQKSKPEIDGPAIVLKVID